MQARIVSAQPHASLAIQDRQHSCARHSSHVTSRDKVLCKMFIQPQLLLVNGQRQLGGLQIHLNALHRQHRSKLCWSSIAANGNSDDRQCSCTQSPFQAQVSSPEEGSKKATACDRTSVLGPSHSPAAELAISAIRGYKGLISPLLPNVCRFQPTCSTYGVEAFQEFGGAKGSILLVWRLLRCNPFRAGYQGQYDPPSWPPVGLAWLFRGSHNQK